MELSLLSCFVASESLADTLGYFLDGLGRRIDH